MAVIHVTEATGGLPNSGRLSGTDGDLVGILDVGLLLNGWSIEFTSGNARVYRPGSGNRFRFHFNDAAASSGDARLCIFRGAESATTATALTDPFPTVAEIADGSSNMIKSSTANTTARNFDLFVGTTWFMLFVNYNGSTNNWDVILGGDCSPNLSGDTYNTISAVRNSAVATSNGNVWSSGSNTSVGNAPLHWSRSFDATVKSTTAGFVNLGSTLGVISGTPTAQSGPSTGIDMEKAAVLDTGSTTTTASNTLAIPKRGYFPNLWLGQHGGRGAVNSRDTFTNSTYNASAAFQIFCVGNASSSAWIIVETTDTWSIPSG